MKLVSILSAAKTATDGYISMSISADLTADENGVATNPQTIPFMWNSGDTAGLGPQVTAWMAAHPDFTIADYVAPTPPAATTYQLTPRQIRRALIDGGVTTDPDGFVTNAINAITDVTQRALALTDWQYAPYYTRDHPLFNNAELLAAANLTSAQIDQLWALAVTEPA